jgi:protease I
MATRKSPPIAFLTAAEGTEQVELTEPWQAVLAMGWRPLLVSPAPGRIQMFNHLDRGDTKEVDVPWTLIEADVVRGRTLTSWPSLRTDLTNAGAAWADEEVVRCEKGPNVLVTSRRPDDLPAFCKAFTEVLSHGL